MELALYSDRFYMAAVGVYVFAMVLHGWEFAGPRTAARACGGGRRVGPRGRRRRAAGGRPPPPRARCRAGPRAWAPERLAASLLVVLGSGLQFVSILTCGQAAARWPLGNMYEFISAITFAAVVTWLVVLKRGNGPAPRRAFVLFPVVVLQFLGCTVLYTQAAPVMPALQSYWLVVHVTTVSIASGLFFVPGIASALFLLRSSDRLPAALAARRCRRPMRWTGSPTASRTSVAFPLDTFAVIAGAIWAEAAWGRFWGWDPKETVAFVAWVIYAAYLHARATAGWRSGGAAWVNVSWDWRRWSSTCSSSTSWLRASTRTRGSDRQCGMSRGP